MKYVPSKDSAQPGIMPSLIRVVAVQIKKKACSMLLILEQSEAWSD